MFKTLLATLMLSTSFGTPLIKTTPYKAQNYQNISGSYTFTDSYDYDTFFTHVDDTEYASLEIITQDDMYIFGNSIQTSDLYMIFIDYNYEGSQYFQIQLWTNEQTMYAHAYWELSEATNFTELNIYGNYSNQVIENFVVTFLSERTITGNAKHLFNLFFTKNGNRYVNYYNGYYHYNLSNWYNPVTNFDYQYGAYYMTDSTIYNCIAQNSPSYLNSVYYYSMYYDTQGNQYVNGGTYYYLRGEYKPVSNIQITGLLPKMVRDSLNAEGVFQFINDTPPTTWYEMILSTMDAPLYFLTSLFSFELFGINLMLAFSGLLTLLIIIVVIKKVV